MEARLWEEKLDKVRIDFDGLIVAILIEEEIEWKNSKVQIRAAAWKIYTTDGRRNDLDFIYIYTYTYHRAIYNYDNKTGYYCIPR